MTNGSGNLPKVLNSLVIPVIDPSSLPFPWQESQVYFAYWSYSTAAWVLTCWYVHMWSRRILTKENLLLRQDQTLTVYTAFIFLSNFTSHIAKNMVLSSTPIKAIFQCHIHWTEDTDEKRVHGFFPFIGWFNQYLNKFAFPLKVSRDDSISFS